MKQVNVHHLALASLVVWLLSAVPSEASMAALRSFPNAEFIPLQPGVAVQWNSTSIEPSKWFIRQYFSDDVDVWFYVDRLGFLFLYWYVGVDNIAYIEISTGEIFDELSYEVTYTLDATVNGRPALVVNWATTNGSENVFQYIVIDRGNGRADIEANFGELEGPFATSTGFDIFNFGVEIYLFEDDFDGVNVVNDLFEDGFFVETHYHVHLFQSIESSLIGEAASYVVEHAFCGTFPSSTCSTSKLPNGRWVIPWASDLSVLRPSKSFNAPYEPLSAGDTGQSNWREFPNADWVNVGCSGSVTPDGPHPLVAYNFYPLLQDVDSKNYTNTPRLRNRQVYIDTHLNGEYSGFVEGYFLPEGFEQCSSRGALVQLSGGPAWVVETLVNDTDGGTYSYQMIIVNRADRNGWGDADVEFNVKYDNFTFPEYLYDFVDIEQRYDWAVEGGEEQLDGAVGDVYQYYYFGYENAPIAQATAAKFAQLNTCDVFFPSVKKCVQHPDGRRRYTLGTATGQLYPGEFAYSDGGAASSLRPWHLL